MSKMLLYTVETNKKRTDCRLLHSGISISKKERRRKLFHFNLVTTLCICMYNVYVYIIQLNSLSAQDYRMCREGLYYTT